MTNPEEHSSLPETPFVAIDRTLRTTAVAQMHLAETPSLWLRGLAPVVKSLSPLQATHPEWILELLARLGIDQALPGGPALVLARAVLEDLKHLALDLRRAGLLAGAASTPQLTGSESRALAEVCSTARVDSLWIFDKLERTILSIITDSSIRSEAETRPER